MKTTDMTEPLETKSERHYFRMSGWMGERWTELLERGKKKHMMVRGSQLTFHTEPMLKL